jgi:hypothetical protein
MKPRFVLLLLALLPSTIIAQSQVAGGQAPSRLTTLVGVGNSFSGFGVLADVRPFAHGPLSFMLSAGASGAYFGDCQPEPWMQCSQSRLAGALGVRANAGHGQHQGFLELAVLPVAQDVAGTSHPGLDQLATLYGLGLQLGYRAVINRRLTVNAMAGGGYALNKDVVASRLKPLIGFGLGYAWPRR